MPSAAARRPHHTPSGSTTQTRAPPSIRRSANPLAAYVLPDPDVPTMASRSSSADGGNTPTILPSRRVASMAPWPSADASALAREAATTRLTVGSLTSYSRAMWAAVLRPDSTSSAISTRCCSVSFGRRPPRRPAARAAASPALMPSRTALRSSAAKPPISCAAACPASVVVSTPSLRLRRPAPAAMMLCARRTTSGRDRPRPPSCGTTTTLSGRSASSTRRNSGCCPRRPEVRSSTTCVQPASASACRCAASVSSSSVLVRR